MARRNAVDGFVPRRSPGVVGGDYIKARQAAPAASSDGLVRREIARTPAQPVRGHEGLAPAVAAHQPAQQQHGLVRTDIDDSLRDIDTPPVEQPKSRFRKKARNQKQLKQRRRMSLRKRIIMWVIIALVVIGAGVAGYLVFKGGNAAQTVFKGNLLGLVQHKALQQDEGGRTNILILGTSEDDPGHQGAYLTDSIMILSVNQEKKDAYMVSVPRDLEVKYGMACNAGYAGKINEYFNCVNGDYESEDAEVERQTETRKFIGDIYGMDIQYSAHVNYSVMRDLVNAVGNITVNIEGSGGAPGILDSNFDWKCRGGNAYASKATMIKNCPPSGHYIDYENGPAVLDAEHALYLAQARGDAAPTYGLGNSNFDREQNQQKIMLAIRDKALSAGTLTNVAKVSKLIDAFGDNLRTNFDMSEVRTLMDLANDIKDDSIERINLLDSGIMTGAAQPTAGKYNFTQLKAFIQKTIYATGMTKEDAHMMVMNASGIEGLAGSESTKLTQLGFTVDSVGNASKATYKVTTIYQVNGESKPLTSAKLESLYGVKPQLVTSIPDMTIGKDTDFVIILQGPSADVSSDTSSAQ